MKKRGCKMLVATLAITMLLTGCNGTANEELLTTEYETGSVESEMIQNKGEDSIIVSEDQNTEESTQLESTQAENTEAVETNVEKECIADNKKDKRNADSNKTETADKGSNAGNTDLQNVENVTPEVIVTTIPDSTSGLVTGVVNNIIKSGMSELEKAKAIHDWMLMNIDYDYQNYLNNTVPATSANVEGVLTTKYAVCDGYAKTFKVLCEAAGLTCEYVTGNTPNGFHAWNQVKIDGTWYNVDVTWDDPVETEFNDHSKNRYNYFLISDAEMYKDHRTQNANYVCNSSLREQAMQMYCPWRDYDYIQSAEELPAMVRAYVDSNTAVMRFRISEDVYNVNEVSSIVYETIGQCNVLKNYKQIDLTYTTDAWGIRTYIFQLELANGVFTKLTRVETVEALKEEILRIKGLPDYTSQEHVICMTEALVNELNHFETIGKWLYFDAGLVLNNPVSSQQCEGVMAVNIRLRPITAEDTYIENATTEAEAEAIIQDRLVRGMTTFKIRYYYDESIPNHSSYVIYELGNILGEKYGLSVHANPQTTTNCFLEFSPIQ